MLKAKDYLIIGAVTLLGIVAILTWNTSCASAEEPKSRMIPPVYLEPGEKDDGKYAEMINKGMLCDIKKLVMGRFEAQGYVPAIRSTNAHDFQSMILMKYDKADDGVTNRLHKMVIVEFPPGDYVACVVFEGLYTQYNNSEFDLHINSPGLETKNWR